MKIFVKGSHVKAQLEDLNTAYITATQDVTITIYGMQGNYAKRMIPATLAAGETIKVILTDDDITKESASPFKPDYKEDTDMTGYIVNPKFQGNSKDGWTLTKADYNEATSYNEQEFWNNSSFSMKQTVKGLPAGRYRLSCQGYYRAGGYAAAASSRTAGTEALNASLYAQPSGKTKASQPLQSIFAEAGKMGFLGVNTTFGYVPNNMEQASQYFCTALYDSNTVEFEVDENQNVEIGIEKASKINDDWTIFTNFRLIRLGDDPTNVALTLPTNPKSVKKDGKFLRKGRLFIVKNNATYDINGRKLE